jgi:hypothetical protein
LSAHARIAFPVSVKRKKANRPPATVSAATAAYTLAASTMTGPSWKLSNEYGVVMPCASGPKTMSCTLTRMIASATSSMNWLCSGRLMNGLMTAICSR